MDDSFSIKSARSDAELAFTDWDGDYFTVELRGAELSAVRRVWAHTGDCNSLVDGLARLAREEKGFAPFSWESIERELGIHVRCDSFGHLYFAVTMRRARGAEDWRLECEIETELGQLPRIAASASQFFGRLRSP